jgi:hypothetical protein
MHLRGNLSIDIKFIVIGFLGLLPLFKAQVADFSIEARIAGDKWSTNLFILLLNEYTQRKSRQY